MKNVTTDIIYSYGICVSPFSVSRCNRESTLNRDLLSLTVNMHEK